MYFSHWVCLHSDIDKRSIKGNESKSRTDKSTGSKKKSRGIKQLQESIPCKHEVCFSSKVLKNIKEKLSLSNI